MGEDVPKIVVLDSTGVWSKIGSIEPSTLPSYGRSSLSLNLTVLAAASSPIHLKLRPSYSLVTNVRCSPKYQRRRIGSQKAARVLNTPLPEIFGILPVAPFAAFFGLVLRLAIAVRLGAADSYSEFPSSCQVACLNRRVGIFGNHPPVGLCHLADFEICSVNLCYGPT